VAATMLFKWHGGSSARRSYLLQIVDIVERYVVAIIPRIEFEKKKYSI
jgi:hypothetical protein